MNDRQQNIELHPELRINANTKAMFKRALEITSLMYDVPGGKQIERDSQFDPTGVMGSLDQVKGIFRDHNLMNENPEHLATLIGGSFLKHIIKHKDEINPGDLPSLRKLFRELSQQSPVYTSLLEEFTQAFPDPNSSE